ncbi:MAG: efflux RND transporter periplasmic adaptor subunit [Candidatus Hydrogenedentes bacterium]|nr:efflux RND transporter periplasmic adaptor subunit [Candidatus Hydrogenedentota bacterium]
MKNVLTREHVFGAGAFAFLFVTGAAIGVVGCGRKTGPPMAPPPPTVKVVEVVQRDIPIFTEWVATTDGLVNATIRAQVQGYLLTKNYREGDFVRKGQLLFEIDPRPFEAAVKQAQGTLSQSEAALNQAKAAVVHSKAQHFIAQTNLARVKPLAEEHAISQMDLDNALGAERSAQADVVGAQASSGAAEAAVAAARAALERAELDLSFTKITSPVDGIAGIATGQIGDLVGPAQTGPLTTVSTVDPILVYFGMSEQDYIETIKKYASETGIIEHGLAVEHQLILADGSVFPQAGTFYAMDRQVDLTTGTLRVELIFPNPGNVLRPGQFARVRAVEQQKGALLVPQRAVTELQGLRQVAVVGADNTVEMRPVKTSVQAGTYWVVEQGLSAGERVVSDGTEKVRQGMLVNPAPDTGTAGQETQETTQSGARPQPVSPADSTGR